MLGYAKSLRALSRGLGSFEMSFGRYEQVPGSFEPDDRFPPAMALRA
jgi:translation elongation factor EF-G